MTLYNSMLAKRKQTQTLICSINIYPIKLILGKSCIVS